MRVKMLKIVTATAVSFVLVGSAIAQNDEPPQNARKLSEIVAKVEQRHDFRYIDEIEWDDGAYEITYYTTDNAKVEINFDPVTAEPKGSK
jgi:hypothetical protein